MCPLSWTINDTFVASIHRNYVCGVCVCERERERQTDRETERDRETKRQRQRDRDRERETETDRQTDIHTQNVFYEYYKDLALPTA